MRVFLKQINGHKLIGLCLLLLSHLTFADFSINDAKTHLVNEVYVLNANLSYTLTEMVVEALQNGISLPLTLTIVIERDRWYLWDEKITTLKQRYQIKYYAFRKQYVIKYLNTGIQKTFDNLNIALAHLGQLEDFPLLDKHLIKGDEHYWVYLHTYLDIESLPVPLRPIAYLSSQWRLNSNWFLCPLQP
ncbi:DUF4390 domain-containing protein [Candidatus Parabeggiatoa sp. HSG14]|uniref:DUF4390 domain-containing protein n=1 Tax=Candidatus Parabeggiatoa sp. HSG14 TaxID=3055593 RepID=UPI0025A92CB8|nr:DUF4390 domain-containing protein [Thiotrichales bacterium HSG14]